MFFIAYAFKGHVHAFAGRVKVVRHSSCRTSAIFKYFCPLNNVFFFRMRIAPTVLLPVVTFATCSVILVSASTEKRQGFFSCDGWGAGCSSSWKVPRPAPKPQPPPQKLRTPHIIRPYWLTTGKGMGESSKFPKS